MTASTQAREAGQRAHSLDSYVTRLVERAPEFTPEQVERLRRILAPVRPAHMTAKNSSPRPGPGRREEGPTQ